MKNEASRALGIVIAGLCLFLSSCASYSHLAPSLQPLDGTWGTDHRSRQELVFLIFGDSGVGGARQANVGRSMQALCEARGCDFALLLGDNIYNRGVRGVDDRQFLTKFDDPYSGLGRLDMWVVPGNHDWRRAESVQAQIAYTARSERWRMPHNHFAVPLLPEWIHLYGLDTTVIHDLARERDAEKRLALAQAREAQIAGARATLCEADGWRLLFGHHPIYSGGQHGRGGGGRGVLRSMEGALLEPLVYACGVHVYFAGHDHHQEHIHGPRFEQIVQGSAGAELRRVDRLDGAERTQAFAASRHGFGLVTATSSRLTIEFFAVEPSAHLTRLYVTACVRSSDAMNVSCGASSNSGGERPD